MPSGFETNGNSGAFRSEQSPLGNPELEETQEKEDFDRDGDFSSSSSLPRIERQGFGKPDLLLLLLLKMGIFEAIFSGLAEEEEAAAVAAWDAWRERDSSR